MTQPTNSQPIASALGHMAKLSLEGEARLTPKPGLVDSANTGAHKDMDLDTFLVSAKALEPYFVAYAEVGLCLGSADAAALADEVRRIGIDAEKAMFAATGGINTHKGANFTFALILAAAGALIAGCAEVPFKPEDTAQLFTLVSTMGATLLDHDTCELLQHTTESSMELSHGQRIYLAQGLKGVRGEAALGYPLMREVFLPYVRAERKSMATPESRRITLLRALVKLMAELEDTNVVHRGGIEALEAHRVYCQNLDAQNLGAEDLVRTLDAYNKELVATNVSPGGAADLLSLGIFFCQLEGMF